MVVEVTEESWFSRLGGAIKGIFIGGLLFLVSFPLLFWNEGRAVRTAKGLKEGAGAVVQVDTTPSKDHEGDFVHVSGPLSTSEVLEDELFNVRGEGIRLRRQVDMYQWVEKSEQEKKKKIGGGTKTTTTYSYTQKWLGHIENSDNFKEKSGHENPKQMPFSSFQAQARDVSLGGFRLPESLINRVDGDQPIAVDKETLPAEIAEKVVIREEGNQGSTIYWSQQPGGPSETPAIGDVRIRFTLAPAETVSIMSQQRGDSFEPFQTSTGTELHMLQMGSVSPEQMIAKAEADNRMFTWLLRGAGLLVMFIGLAMIMRPLSVLGDVIPFFGSILEMGTMIVAGLVSLSLSLCTISFAWIFYRPLLGVPLLAAGIAIIVFVVSRARKRKQTAGRVESATV